MPFASKIKFNDSEIFFSLCVYLSMRPCALHPFIHNCDFCHTINLIESSKLFYTYHRCRCMTSIFERLTMMIGATLIHKYIDVLNVLFLCRTTSMTKGGTPQSPMSLLHTKNSQIYIHFVFILITVR